MGRKREKRRPEALAPAPKILSPKSRSRVALLVLLALGVAAGVVAVWRVGKPALDGARKLLGVGRRAPLNVVLVTADTLRSDKLGCYGSANVATPNLDRLAEAGVLFENATTVTPLTLPAHSSILTGTFPMSQDRKSVV